MRSRVSRPTSASSNSAAPVASPGRRRFVKALTAAGGLYVAGAYGSARSAARVVVIGGGFGGATAARYLRRLDPALDVTLIAPGPTYYTCPFSNAVITGMGVIDTLAQNYGALAAVHGVTVIDDHAAGIDPDRRTVTCRAGHTLRYDRLVVAPGISLRWGTPEGYDRAASRQMPHAWIAGAQTVLLGRRLQALPDGGVVAIAVPAAPFRCPPGPYERASLIAAWLQVHRPRAKVLILDANGSFTKQDLFQQAWRELYGDRIEWVPVLDDGEVQRVDVATNTLYTQLGEYRVDLANVIPPQRAGRLALDNGLANASGWCPVEARSFESTLIPNVHVIGDACLAGPIPKSASAANSQAKTCALAIVALLHGDAAPEPSYHNTCYSLVAEDYGISVSMIYRLENGEIRGVAGAGGTSPIGASRAYRATESDYARGWYRSITADAFS